MAGLLGVILVFSACQSTFQPAVSEDMSDDTGAIAEDANDDTDSGEELPANAEDELLQAEDRSSNTSSPTDQTASPGDEVEQPSEPDHEKLEQYRPLPDDGSTLLPPPVQVQTTNNPLSPVDSTDNLPVITDQSSAISDHCTNGLFDRGERFVDCGGPCPTTCIFSEKCGSIGSEERWAGNILVTCDVIVPDGISLRISAGSVIAFEPSRNYRIGKKIALLIRGGNLIVEGSAGKQVWFTSSGVPAINGDWLGIVIDRSPMSTLSYAIIEFASVGLSIFDSDISIDRSILRWNNSGAVSIDGSEFHLIRSRIYENGAVSISLSQFSEAWIERTSISKGYLGLYTDNSIVTIDNNYFSDFSIHTGEVIAADRFSRLTIQNNVIKAGQEQAVFGIDPDLNPIFLNNTVSVSAENDLSYDYPDLVNQHLDYLPGDPDDLYAYVFDQSDDTRLVTRRLGRGLLSGNSLTYKENALWRFAEAPDFYGELIKFIRIDLDDESTTFYRNEVIDNPHGLTNDGQYFYTSDISAKKIVKFTIVDDALVVLAGIKSPESEYGGLGGLTTDGIYLYLIGADYLKLFKFSIDLVSETVVDTIAIAVEPGYLLGSAIAYDGKDFWTDGGCSRGLCRFSQSGVLLGGIYRPALGVGDLAWDGTRLWSLQQTCPTWDDPKIFQIEIIDDRL